jgi:hypothetical protein
MATQKTEENGILVKKYVVMEGNGWKLVRFVYKAGFGVIDVENFLLSES